MIDGKAHAACKHCGWTCGPQIHTTGAHGKASAHNYTPSKTLRMNIAKVESSSGGNDQDKDKSSEAKEKSSAGDAFNFMGLANALSKMEREEDNPEAAMFAAHFGKLFKSYLKD